MYANVRKTVLALAFTATVPFHLNAAPKDPTKLTAKQVRSLEATAKTGADHARLAAYYQTEIEATQKKLKRAEELMVDRAWMVGWTKTPNGYTTAQDMARDSRGKLEKLSTLHASHQKAAQSLNAGR